MRYLRVPAPILTRSRVPLAGTWWPPGRMARTVHVGRSAVLLGPRDPSAPGLLPVTGPDRGLVPGGVCLPGTAELRALADAARAADHLDLSAWEPVLADATRTDLAVHPGRLDPAAVGRMVSLCAAVPGAG